MPIEVVTHAGAAHDRNPVPDQQAGAAVESEIARGVFEARRMPVARIDQVGHHRRIRQDPKIRHAVEDGPAEIDHHPDVAGLRHQVVMCPQAVEAAVGVVGRGDHDAVGAGVLGVPRHVNRHLRARVRRAGDYRHPARSGVDHRFHRRLTLVVGQRVELARAASHNDGRHVLAAVVFGQAAHAVQVERVVVLEVGGHRDDRAAQFLSQLFRCHLRFPLCLMESASWGRSASFQPIWTRVHDAGVQPQRSFDKKLLSPSNVPLQKLFGPAGVAGRDPLDNRFVRIRGRLARRFRRHLVCQAESPAHNAEPLHNTLQKSVAGQVQDLAMERNVGLLGFGGILSFPTPRKLPRIRAKLLDPGFPFWPWHGYSIHSRCPEYHVFSR